jgi:hypothetical protein
MVPFSWLLPGVSGSEGLGSQTAPTRALTLTTVIIKLRREEAHEICMGEKWI